MSFAKLAVLYGACTVLFFALDFVWLSTATSRLYKPMLGSLLAEKPNLVVAALFYLVYVVGIIALAVVPGLKEGAVVGSLWRGALFGFLAYATYDLSNLSTLAGWPWQIAAIDIVWGTVLNSVVAVAGFFVGRSLGM